MMRISTALPLCLTLLVIGCGGGGGGDDDDSSDSTSSSTESEGNPVALTLVDSVPGAGVTVDPLDTGFRIAHLGHSNATFSYSGTCNPDGSALRRGLFDLSDKSVDQVIDHRLECGPLEPMENYSIRVAATREDARFETGLDFVTANEAERGLTVKVGVTIPAGRIEGIFAEYVRRALIDELDLPEPVKDRVTRLVLEISEKHWPDIVSPDAKFDVASQGVAYRSRKPDGSTSDLLTGLVTFPVTAGAGTFNHRDQVVVLAHATGSTPSELEPGDPWVIIANQLASRGYLVVVPDNWGRGGTGADPETYLMASRTASNALDLLKAVLASKDYTDFHDNTSEVTIIGYSQGGHTALALWLLMETTAKSPAVKEVHAGGAPHNLYGTFRGLLQHLNGSCNDGPYCRSVDKDTALPYAVDRIIPALLAYTKTSLVQSDLVDGDDIKAEFVSGFLGDDARYDTFKVLLQLNSHTNLAGLASAIEVPDTRIHLYHAELDRLVPYKNTEEVAAALTGFNLEFHEDRCNSGGYEVIDGILKKAGALHVLCGLAVMDDIMGDLR